VLDPHLVGDARFSTGVLAFVPSGYQAFGVREHLRVGRTSGGDLSVRLGLPFSFHLAAVEAHDPIVA
jgi:hypothetical protein